MEVAPARDASDFPRAPVTEHGGPPSAGATRATASGQTGNPLREEVSQAISSADPPPPPHAIRHIAPSQSPAKTVPRSQTPPQILEHVRKRSVSNGARIRLVVAEIRGQRRQLLSSGCALCGRGAVVPQANRYRLCRRVAYGGGMGSDDNGAQLSCKSLIINVLYC